LNQQYSFIYRFIYITSSHPIILITLIFLQTSCLCLIGWVKLKISWFSYVLFLIFLGGLIVLFIYITSLASNELIPLKISNGAIIVLVIFLFSWIIFNSPNIQQFFNYQSENIFKTFNFMYRSNSIILTLTTIVYLLLTLIIVVKISNKFDAPIKNIIFL